MSQCAFESLSNYENTSFANKQLKYTQYKYSCIVNKYTYLNPQSVCLFYNENQGYIIEIGELDLESEEITPVNIVFHVMYTFLYFFKSMFLG